MDAKELIDMIEKGPPDGNVLAVKRATISMPWGLFADAAEAIVAERYSSFSDYVQGLIRGDKLRRDDRSVPIQRTQSDFNRHGS
jgi:Arc/MetJ-type ribon-helix-helix transcriptional regulator